MSNELLISRSQALSQGLTKYFTGKPCKNGGVAERLVSNWHCLCRHCSDAKSLIYSTEQRSIKNREFYEANREKMLSKQKARRLGNQQKILDAKRSWAARNRDRVRASSTGYKLQKRLSVPAYFGELDEFVTLEAFHLAELRKQSTGAAWQVDHMIPLRGKTASGLHVWNNLQVIPASLNQAKKNRMILVDPGQWIQCIGGA